MNSKVIKTFLILFFSVFIMSIGISANYYSEIRQTEKLSNAFYEKESIYFTSSKDEINYESLYDSFPERSVIYQQLPTVGDVRTILFKGRYAEPEMAEGRFFISSDFKGDKKLAVVGKNVNTMKVDGKETFCFEDQNYEVIGKIGYNIPTKLDETIMLSMNQKLLSGDGKFILSGDSEKSNYSFLGNELLLGEVTVFDLDKPNILKISNLDQGQTVMLVVFLAFLFFNSGLLLFYWLKSRKDEFIIKKMNGYNDLFLFREIQKDFSIISIVGILVGICVGIAFSQIFYSMHYLWVLLGTILSATSFELVFILLFQRMLKNIEKEKLGVYD